MATTITDLFEAYDAGCGGETPERTLAELRQLWHAADCRYNSETDETAFWTLVFGEPGSASWAFNDGGEFPTDAQWQAFEAERDALRLADLPAIIPDEIRAARKSAGLSQHQLARALDVTQSTVARWESGLSPVAHPGMLRLALGALTARHDPR